MFYRVFIFVILQLRDNVGIFSVEQFRLYLTKSLLSETHSFSYQKAVLDVKRFIHNFIRKEKPRNKTQQKQKQKTKNKKQKTKQKPKPIPKQKKQTRNKNKN